MALETASYISQLVATNPTASDPKSQGDNHLRMVKTVLQTQFPNLGAVAVTPTATQINNFIANGGIYSVGTSVTSLTVGAGSQTFTTQTGRGFAIGQSIKITSDADANTFMTGVCTAYDTTTGAMSVLVDGVSGSGTSALWSISVFIDSGPADLIRSARTSNTMLVAADKGTLIDITSGTFSQTFDAAATLGDGWWCLLRNSGTGVVTLDPNAAETIDGVATKAIYPKQSILIQCNGVELNTAIDSSGSLILLSSINAVNASTIDVESAFNADFDTYLIVASNLTTSAAGGANVFARMKIGGAYDTGANYKYHLSRSDSSSAAYVGTNDNAATYINLSVGLPLGPSDTADLQIHLNGPSSTARKKTISWTGVSVNGANIYQAFGAGGNTGTSALTGFRIFTSTGTLTGAVSLFGIKKS